MYFFVCAGSRGEAGTSGLDHVSDFLSPGPQSFVAEGGMSRALLLNFLDTFSYEVLFGISGDLIMDKDLITSDFVRRGNPKIRFYFDKR